MSVTRTLKAAWSKFVQLTKNLTVNLGTLLYYRFFRQNTLLPILHIAKCVQRGDSDLELVNILTHWRERKLYELHFIQVASTILAAAVIGCFSWPPVSDGFWIGPASWYCSLVLSIFAILLSSGQAFIFSALNRPTVGLNSSGDFRRYLALILAIPPEDSRLLGEDLRRESLRNCVPRWKMVFTWQAPMMLMAYAVTFFGAGLTVYVGTPLFNGEVTTPGGKTSIFYLTVAGLAVAIFVYCSFWAYRFINLDQITEAAPDTQILPLPYPSSSTSISPRIQLQSK